MKGFNILKKDLRNKTRSSKNAVLLNLVFNPALEFIKAAFVIRKELMGSEHCPSVFLDA